MALTCCVLASGSKGNATWVAGPAGALLLDCGLSARETLRRLSLMGLDHLKLKGIVVTHEHRDHVAGVRVLAKQLRLPVMATKATWKAMALAGEARHQAIVAGEAFALAGMTLHPFSVPHDAVDTVGLVVSAGAARLGLCTDLGQALALVRTRLAGCQALVLEANHDPELLAAGPYPPWLKQRVRSRHGHLSNRQGAELLAEVHHPDLRRVVLAHLSEVNNRPELARAEVQGALEGLGSRAEVAVAEQRTPSETFEV
jgi:phosphoribosyl 1,2-cyclic phosphodiesterase